ncbi:hypothetical protein VH441_00625 [Psychrobacter sp. HD31]|uniref:phage integrase central domain-containing protein n=1 Tax=Psychrobacter sp. HD31 TaxID=3112003 RepID=UPI003DA371C4
MTKQPIHTVHPDPFNDNATANGKPWVTNLEQAKQHKYVLIATSKKGNHINVGFDCTDWDYVADMTIHIANGWLECINDTVDSILIVNRQYMDYEELSHALNNGLTNDDIRNHPDYSTKYKSHNDEWSTRASNFAYVHDIEQIKPTDPLNINDVYPSKRGEYLLTMVTLKGHRFIADCASFGSSPLNNIEDTTTRHNHNLYRDDIGFIMMSKDDNAHHLAVINQILQTRLQTFSDEINGFIHLNPSSPVVKTTTMHRSNLFDDIAQGWFAEHKAQLDKSTNDRLYAAYIHFVKPLIGSMDIRDISHGNIEAIMLDVQEKADSDQAMAIIRETGLIFDHAMTHGLTHYNPAGLLLASISDSINNGANK